MLDAGIIAATYFGEPDPVHRRAMCGRSAVEFEEVHSVLLSGCAAPAVATWLAWEHRSLAEAQQRIRELN